MSSIGSRVPIPNSLRKTIEGIKEIAGKHSDDDVYAMLVECNMDPDETAQRLLYLDTFHEVKKKRDRRKVVVNGRVSEESRRTSGTQARGARGGRGSSSDISRAGMGRNVTIRKENGVSNHMGRGAKPPLTVPEKTENKLNPNVTNVPTSVSENGTSPEGGLQSVAGIIKHELNNNMTGRESAACSLAGNKSSTTLEVAKNIQTSSKAIISTKEVLEESEIVENSQPLEPLQQLSVTKGHDSFDVISTQDIVSTQPPNGASTVVASDADKLEAEASSQLLRELNVSAVKKAASEVDVKLQKNISSSQPVTFPDFLQVPEDFKNGLTFGSLDAVFEHSVKFTSDPGGREGIVPANQGLQENDKAVEEPPVSNPSESSTAGGGDYPDNSHSLPNLPDGSSHLENISSGAIPKQDESKQEIMLPQGGPQFPFVHPAVNYGFPFFQLIPGNQCLQSEGPQPQSGNALVSSASGSTITATYPVGVGHGPVAVSPPPFPFFRQPYAPNFFPHSPYYPPFYLAPNTPPFLGHSGIPQQPFASNVYLSPLPATPGIKFSATQDKQGINTGNVTQVGVASVYGSCSPNGALTGSSASNEDLRASELKEKSVHLTGQQYEGPLVWLPSSGREIPSLHAASLYSHLPQARVGHSPFAGIYDTTETLTRPSSTSGPVEAVGPPSLAYQQPQQATN